MKRVTIPSKVAKLAGRGAAKAAGRGTLWGARSGVLLGRSGARAGARAAIAGLRERGRGGRSRARANVRGWRAGTRAATSGAKLGLRVAAAGPQIAATVNALQRDPRPARPAVRVPSAVGFASGVVSMYLLDPVSGKRRRHVAREKALKLLRRGGREAARKARYGEGVAEGKVHAIKTEREAAPHALPDDVTLAHEVQGAIAREAGEAKGSVNVNAENGVVYLRGRASSRELSERLAAAAASVPGTRGVKNLLHLPGEPAHTIEDARGA